jgi:hypothetical protein
VDEVEHRADAVERRRKRQRVENVTADDLGRCRHAAFESLRATRQAAHPLASRLERGEEPTTDVARCASDQDEIADLLRVAPNASATRLDEAVRA